MDAQNGSADPLAAEVDTGKPGEIGSLRVKVAAIPEASFQWFKNGKPVRGATNAALTLENARFDDAAAYVVAVTNEIGTVTSQQGMLQVK